MTKPRLSPPSITEPASLRWQSLTFQLEIRARWGEVCDNVARRSDPPPPPVSAPRDPR